jgi:hypothetical protein
MKMSPLDIKKKKTIQKIRTLINDHPELHPLAHKVLLSATYTVLSRLHKDILEMDGPSHKVSKDQRMEKIAEAIERAKRFTAKRSIGELEDKTKKKVKKKTRDRDMGGLEELEVVFS